MTPLDDLRRRRPLWHPGRFRPDSMAARGQALCISVGCVLLVSLFLELVR